MAKSISFDEQETVIVITPPQISKQASVYSCIPSTVLRLRKLADQRPDVVRIVSEDDYGIYALVDRSCIRIAPKRQMTEEQRKAATERLAAGRKKKVTS